MVRQKNYRIINKTTSLCFGSGSGLDWEFRSRSGKRKGFYVWRSGSFSWNRKALFMGSRRNIRRFRAKYFLVLSQKSLFLDPDWMWISKACIRIQNSVNLDSLMDRSQKKVSTYCTLIKKKINFFLIYKKIQSGAVAKSYMRKGFLIYEEMRKYFPIYEEAVGHIWLYNCSILNFLIYEENFIFFFISVLPW